MNEAKALLEKALSLKPVEKATLVDGILNSLDEPDKNISEIWDKEAQKRLAAYRSGRLKGIEYREVFGEDLR